MGKSGASKARHNGQSLGRLPDFFPASGLPSGLEPPDRPAGNMAPAQLPISAGSADERRGSAERSGEAAEEDGALVTRRDLMTVSSDLKHHISALLEGSLAEIKGQLQTINTSLKETAETAGKAYDLATSTESAVKDIRASEKALRDRVAVLELKARALNLKFRGLPEHPDINNNLQAFMTSWFATFLHTTGDASFNIMAAYRLGAASMAKPNYPRDVLVQFQSLGNRNSVLSAARQQGALKYQERTVLALFDLPPESLMKRKQLKPITDHLKTKNVRFRWSPTSDLIVTRNGAQYRAEDIPSGRTLLEALELPLPAT